MTRPLTFPLFFLLLAGAAQAADPGVLRVSAIPDEAPNELIKKFGPLASYLEQATGMKVKFTPVTDYAATVEGLSSKRIDLVWLGGFTFVQARRRTGNANPIVQREEDAGFHTKFIVPASSTAQKLSDLKGGSFAFGSVSSTSGHLMPRYYLMKQGIDPDKDFTKISYSGAHDATARWVEAGKVGGGALNESVYQKLIDEKRLDPTKVRVLWTTPEFFDYNWTVGRHLDPQIVEKLKAAFLALDYSNPAHRPILDLQRTKKFIATSPANYQSIEEAADFAGLIQGKTRLLFLEQ